MYYFIIVQFLVVALVTVCVYVFQRLKLSYRDEVFFACEFQMDYRKKNN